MQCMYNATLRHVPAIMFVVEKQSECVSVALGIQHATRMRHIVICSLYASIFFITLPHKRDDFREKKIIEQKMCVLIFSTFAWNISQSKKKWGRCDQKCVLVFTVVLSRILMKIEISPRFFEKKNTKISNVTLIRHVGAELFHVEVRTDGQTDMKKLLFKQFCWRA